jgi:hypothetical protein
MASHRRRRLEGEIGTFLQQYARKAHRGHDPNDRGYDRDVEAAVQRMSAEELDALVHDAPDEALDHAERLVDAFVAPSRRGRWHALLAAGPRGRAKFRAALAHWRELDPPCLVSIPGSEQTADGVAALLRGLGAPATCVVLAGDTALDGRVLPLAETLARVVGRGMGAVLSCVPGELGYYEGEDPGVRYILRRPVV